MTFCKYDVKSNMLKVIHLEGAKLSFPSALLVVGPPQSLGAEYEKEL